MIAAAYGVYKGASELWGNLSPETKSWLSGEAKSAGKYLYNAMTPSANPLLEPDMASETPMVRKDFVMPDDIAASPPKKELITETWDCHFTWENEPEKTATFIFKNDGTVVIEDEVGSQDGEWAYFGRVRVLCIVSASHVNYNGTLDPDDTNMSGTMTRIMNKCVHVGIWKCKKIA